MSISTAAMVVFFGFYALSVFGVVSLPVVVGIAAIVASIALLVGK